MHRSPLSTLPVAGALALCSAACGVTGEDIPVDMPDTSAADEGCASIFHQDVFPDYRVSIAPDELAALEDEFLNRAEREELGLDHNPYHPIELETGGETIEDAMIRLKGQSSWWQAIMLDDDPKMQFVISFNEVDPDGRFHGLRKVELDMPRSDHSFLRQRMALYYLRSAGVTAQCANSARLYINGDYYGLYTHLERLDKEFLQRHYGELDEGNLWKGARFIETNEDSFEWDRLSRLWSAQSAEELEALVDLDASVEVWAHEAIAPHFDGYYNGRANFFVYDHPTRGFVWLSHDLDTAFDWVPATLSPQYPECEDRHPNDRQHWALAMSEERWVEAYRRYVMEARDAFDVFHMQDLLVAASQQIADAAEQDPMKPFGYDAHRAAVDSIYSFMPARAETLDRWIGCWESGGEDGDGDGFVFCNDCDDDRADIWPGAEEVCNGVDDDCDGQIDELAMVGEVCE